jgi:SpoVK/Ycf46/Vps4 family AAA+-type ATPase
VILEYTAGLFDVACSEKERERYYQLVFENWAHFFGKTLEKRFPKNQIVAQVLEMKNPNKSGLIEKIYRYVLSEETVGDTLKIEDFHILKRFKTLGMMDEKKDRRKTILKMESDLVGMDDVKRQVYEIVDVMKFNKKRAQMGLGSGGFHNVHLLIGAPGTAKTTIAQMMGDIMCEQKLLSGNRFVSINGADLKGMFVGHSAPKTRRYFEDYDIIFIDEAYSLTSERDMDSFSQEALAQLIIELEKHGLDRLVLFAGYGGKNVQDKDNKMNQFLNANPGIRSRINSTIFFNSYTPDEMVEIVHRQAKNQKYVLSHDADELIRTYFEERVKATDFGNGREARSLLENITMKAAVRTMANQDSQITKTMLQKLTAEDVKLALSQIRSSYRQQLGRRGKEYGFKMGE